MREDFVWRLQNFTELMFRDTITLIGYRCLRIWSYTSEATPKGMVFYETIRPSRKNLWRQSSFFLVGSWHKAPGFFLWWIWKCRRGLNKIYPATWVSFQFQNAKTMVTNSSASFRMRFASNKRMERYAYAPWV